LDQTKTKSALFVGEQELAYKKRDSCPLPSTFSLY